MQCTIKKLNWFCPIAPETELVNALTKVRVSILNHNTENTVLFSTTESITWSDTLRAYTNPSFFV
jgi:hypothetical protein